MGETIRRETGPDRHAATVAASRVTPSAASSDRGAPLSPAPRQRRPRWLPDRAGARLGGVVITVLAVGFYYGIGALAVQRIADDPAFGPAAAVETGESRTLAVVAALIRRETETHHWVANDPAFLPGALLTHMAAYQQGIVDTLAATVAAMADQAAPGDADAGEADTGRPLWDGLWSRRGSDRAAAAVALLADLRQAAALLATPGTAWILDISRSFGRQPSAETQYGAARTLVESVNQRLARGTAVLPDGADLVAAIVDRLLADLHPILTAIDARLAAPPEHPVDDGTPGARYYRIKGQVYAMALILDAMGRDHPDRLSDPALADAWTRAVDHLRAAATPRPLFVSNGAPDALLIPNHWAGQGYRLHRATAALTDVRARLVGVTVRARP